MADKCKLGDIAIIIKDRTGCEANIGRLVTVMGPRKVFPLRGTVWHIKPVIGSTMTYIESDGRTVGVGPATSIEHEDDWLLPIRPEPERQAIEEERELVLPSEMETV